MAAWENSAGTTVNMSQQNIPYSPIKTWHKAAALITWVVVTVFLAVMTYNRIRNPIEATGSQAFGFSPTLIAGVLESPDPVVIRAANDSGETIDFIIWPLYKTFPWVKGSDREIEKLGDIYTKGKDILSPQLQANIKEVPEVIVVGTADIRMKKDLRGEETLAGKRTRNLEYLVTLIKEDSSSVLSWNLGKRNAESGSSENFVYEDQRRVIIIGLKRANKSMELKSALRRALESRKEEYPIFKQLLYSYSKSNDFDIK